MHIVFIDTAPLSFGGGYEHFVLDAAAFGAAAGHDVTVVVPSPRIAQAISFVTNLTFPKRSLSDAEVTRKLGRAQLIAGGRGGAKRAVSSADLIYTKNEPQEILFALNARSRSTPLMVGFHSATQKTAGRTASLRNGIYTSAPYRRLFASVDAVHLLHPSQEQFVAQQLRYPSTSTHLVPNGVDVEQFSPAWTRSATFRVLFAGRFILQKGADLVFEAIHILNKTRPELNIHFTLVGDGSMRPVAEQLAATFRNVTYRGYSADMAAVYKDQDLVLVPSRWETFGLVAIEALSSGVPIAVSPIDVFTGLLDCEGVVSFDATGGSWADLVRSLHHEWSSDRQSYDRRRSAARAYAKARFDGRNLSAELFRTMEAVRPTK